MNRLLATSRRLFVIAKQQQYGRYYLLEYRYVGEAYYRSCTAKPDSDNIKDKRKQYLKDFEESHPMYILGGEMFPMSGSTFIVNCDDTQLPSKLCSGDPFVKEGIVVDHTIVELNKENAEKFSQVAKFYEYK